MKSAALFTSADHQPDPLQGRFEPNGQAASFVQHQLWAINGRVPAQVDRKIVLTMRIPGPLDLGKLEGALCDVVERHESLRTVFREVDGELRQIVRPPATARPVMTRMTVADVELAENISRISDHPWDVSHDLPMRACVFEINDNDHTLVLHLNSLVFDAGSIRPLRSDLSRAYVARCDGGVLRLPRLPMQYADYTLWQRQQIGDDASTALSARQLSYWGTDLRQLAKIDPVLSGVSDSVPFFIDADLHAALVAFVRDARASVFMVLHACLSLLLSSMGGSTDVVIGTAVSGRSGARFKQLIGILENILVLRSDTSGNPRFIDLLTKIKQKDLNAYANQDLPFASVMEKLLQVDAGTCPVLFPVMLLLDNVTVPDRAMRFSTRLVPGSSYRIPVPLTFDLVESKTLEGVPFGIRGELIYDSCQFDRGSIESLRDRLISVLHSAIRDPRQSIGDLGAQSLRITLSPKKESSGPIWLMEFDPPGSGPGIARHDGSYVAASDILQDQLLAIWEEVLNVQPVGIWDDFFELGGNAQLGARMLDTVADICGNKLPLSFISQGTTIQRLADELLTHVPVSSIIEVQAGNSREITPLFLVHGDISGGGFYVLELARGLDRDQPLFVLQQHGLNGKDVPDSIQQMAEDHVETIRTVQPRGPYRLGGHCVGGLIAFEAAQRLVRDHEKVELLIMIDPPYGGRLPKLSPPSRPPSNLLKPRVRSAWLLSRYMVALHAYTPAWYPHKVTLLWAADNPFKGTHPREIFMRFAPEVDFRQIPGTHVTCLGRHVRSAAKEISFCLAASRRRSLDIV